MELTSRANDSLMECWCLDDSAKILKLISNGIGRKKFKIPKRGSIPFINTLKSGIILFLLCKIRTTESNHFITSFSVYQIQYSFSIRKFIRKYILVYLLYSKLFVMYIGYLTGKQTSSLSVY